MWFGMLSEASDVVICYAPLLRIKAKVWRQKILILCDGLCQQQSPLCATLFFFCSLGTQTGIHLSLCVNIPQCSLNPHDLVPLQLPSQARRRGRGHSAPCVVIAVTRLSASSTCLGSVSRSSHQSVLFESCAGCVHTCKAEADSWQSELRANRRGPQKSVNVMQPSSPSNA